MWFTTRGLQLPKVVQIIIDANNSIPPKTDLSTDSEEKASEMRKYDIVDSDLNADGKIKDEYKLR